MVTTRSLQRKKTAGEHLQLPKIVLLGVSLFVVVVALYHTVSPDPASGWPLKVTVVCLIWLGVYVVCSYLLFSSIYLFTSLYVAGLCVFHLGVTASDAFGLFPDVRWDQSPLLPWLEQAGWYTALALGSLGIGFSAALRPRDFSKTIENSAVARQALATVYWGGLGLFFASMVFLFIAIHTFGNLLNYSRMDFFHGVGDTRGVGSFLMVFPTSLIMLVVGARTRIQKLFSTSVSAVGFVILLLSGYRSMALFPLLTGMTLWTKTNRRIPVWFTAVVAVGLILTISVIGILRAMGTYGAINAETVQTALRDSSVQDTFELGGTAGVLANVLRLVPKTDNFQYGKTYVRHLAGAIPNMTAESKESLAAPSYQGPHVIDKLPPSRWITYRIAPQKFLTGEGVGFSAIAEPYINFGTPGVLVYFVLIGYIFARLDAGHLLFRPRRLFVVCVIMWPLLKTVRNDFGVFIKPVAFCFIALLIWQMFSWSFVSRRRPSKAG